MLIYLGKYRPFDAQPVNTLETINEYLNLIMMYHMLCVSEINPSIEVRYNVIGKSFIATTLGNIAFNACVVIYAQYRVMRGSYLKAFRTERYLEKRAKVATMFREGNTNDCIIRPGMSFKNARKEITTEAIEEVKRDIVKRQDIMREFG